jgi:Fe-S-cluster containining protein
MPPVSRKHGLKGFKCKQCGNCCLNIDEAYQGHATEADMELWESELRLDILKWVGVIPLGKGRYAYDRWISPRTGDYVYRCPWLRKLPNQDKYICRINDVKPEACRIYPRTRKHAKETGCKGFD